MALMHALINFSLNPHLGSTAGVEGQRDGKFREGKWYCVCSVGECTCRCTCMYGSVLVWHVCVALRIVVGAWPMAGTLWQLLEYYCYS